MKYHFSILFSVSIVLFSLMACNSIGNKSAEQLAYTNSQIPESSIPKWYFNTQEDTLGNPQTQIFLVIKDSIKITNATAPFTVIEKQEYADKKLPINTLTACSGFWAGLEQQLIVVDSSDFWVVKAKYQDEQSEEPEDFETIKVIKR
jgi:hypothetical protein